MKRCCGSDGGRSHIMRVVVLSGALWLLGCHKQPAPKTSGLGFSMAHPSDFDSQPVTSTFSREIVSPISSGLTPSSAASKRPLIEDKPITELLSEDLTAPRVAPSLSKW